MSVAFDNTLDLQVLTARLERVHGLSQGDRAALERLPLHKAVIAPGGTIVWAGNPADRCAIVLEGIAFSYKLTGSGGRQIVNLHLPGDLPDLQSLGLGTTDTGVTAMSPCHVGYVPSDELSALCSRRPSLAAVLWRETLLQAAIVREWLLNIGRRDALAGLGHILCEVVMRHRAAGLTSDYGCRFRATQTALGDMLGLSTVHVNRMIQELRRDRLIAWDEGHLTVLDWGRLCTLSDFDPAYLHIDRGPHAS